MIALSSISCSRPSVISKTSSLRRVLAKVNHQLYSKTLSTLRCMRSSSELKSKNLMMKIKSISSKINQTSIIIKTTKTPRKMAKMQNIIINITIIVGWI